MQIVRFKWLLHCAVACGVLMAFSILVCSPQCVAWQEDPVVYDSNRYPCWSSDGTKIAFESLASGRNQIWVVNTDGSSLAQLTNEPYGAGGPVWGRDGQHVYFIRWDDDHRTDIWRVSADGSNPERVTSTDYNEFSFAISPDGAKLVADTQRGILIYSISGAADTYVAASGEDADPDWAPDGTKVVFIRKGNVWKRNVDLTGLTQLTDAECSDETPHWSPSGTPIVFSSDRLPPRKLWRVAPDGTGLQRVMSDANEPDTVADLYPAWSPDGSRIAFARDDGESCDIWVVNADGTGLSRLTCQVATPTFDPDGGTYTGSQSVTIACATAGATIRYTTDGTVPTETSPVYTEPITIESSLTLKARAWKAGWFPSHVKSAEYVIE